MIPAGPAAAGSAAPALSVILVADRYETVAEVVSHLRAQARAREIEVVLVLPRGGAGTTEIPANNLNVVTIVELDELARISHAQVCGVRAAGAPLVAFGETHAFPQAGWAEAILSAHEDGWTVVAPSITNANPQTLRSWVGLLLDYGPWLDVREPSSDRDVPGHNSVFKRDALLAYGDALEHALENHPVMVAELRARGHRAMLTPGARVAHVNVTRLDTWPLERVTAGGVFAAARARDWPPLRRLAYAAAAPLIPAVRLRRVLRDLRRSGHERELYPRILPLLLTALLLSALGEALGYALGGRWAEPAANRIELHRLRYVRRSERP